MFIENQWQETESGITHYEIKLVDVETLEGWGFEAGFDDADNQEYAIWYSLSVEEVAEIIRDYIRREAERRDAKIKRLEEMLADNENAALLMAKVVVDSPNGRGE